MGLDIMLLIMEVEERFDITLPDERAERIFTVGDLYHYILARTRRNVPAPCPTGQAFYRLRRTLTADFGLERNRIRPAARLRDLFPRASRGASWPRLAAALGVGELPDPEPRRKRRQPSARAFGITLAAVTAALWLLYPVLPFLPGGGTSIAKWLLVSLLAAFDVCVFFGMWWLGIRLEPILDPLPAPRVRDLAVRMAGWPREQYPVADAADPAAAAVWTDLTAILSRQTGVPAAEIRPEQRFEDLWRS